MSSEVSTAAAKAPLIGKIVVFVLFGFSMLAVFAAYMYHASMIARASEFWQSDGEACLRYSEDIQAWRLEKALDAPAGADAIEVNGQTYIIAERKRVMLEGRAAALAERQQFDLSYLRRALMYDTSYDWDANPGDCQPNWQYAVQFHHEGETVTAVFSLTCPRLFEPKTGRTLVLTEPATKLFGQFFERGVFAPVETKAE